MYGRARAPPCYGSAPVRSRQEPPKPRSLVRTKKFNILNKHIKEKAYFQKAKPNLKFGDLARSRQEVRQDAQRARAQRLVECPRLDGPGPEESLDGRGLGLRNSRYPGKSVTCATQQKKCVAGPRLQIICVRVYFRARGSQSSSSERRLEEKKVIVQNLDFGHFLPVI